MNRPNELGSVGPSPQTTSAYRTNAYHAYHACDRYIILREGTCSGKYLGTVGTWGSGARDINMHGPSRFCRRFPCTRSLETLPRFHSSQLGIDLCICLNTPIPIPQHRRCLLGYLRCSTNEMMQLHTPVGLGQYYIVRCN